MYKTVGHTEGLSQLKGSNAMKRGDWLENFYHCFLILLLQENENYLTAKDHFCFEECTKNITSIFLLFLVNHSEETTSLHTLV